MSINQGFTEQTKQDKYLVSKSNEIVLARGCLHVSDIINRDSSIVFFSVVVLLVKYNFCVSSKHYIGWEFVYFATRFIGILQNLYFRTAFTLLLLIMVSVSHIYYWQIARLHCVCLSYKGCLIWVKFVKIPKQKFERQLSVINPVLIKHFVSTNQCVHQIWKLYCNQEYCPRIKDM